MENELVVNTIITQRGIQHGLVLEHNLVMDMLRVTLGDRIAVALVTMLNKLPDGGHHVYRFCQFVVYVERRPETGYSMKFTDFQNNIDNALDEYLELEGKDWPKETLNNYIAAASEAARNASERAKLTSLDGLIYL